MNRQSNTSNQRSSPISIVLRPLEQAIHLIMACTILGMPMAGMLVHLTAWAQTAESSFDFNISAGSLETALSQFAQKTNITLSFDPGATRNRHSNGLKGRYSTESALQMLIDGSGLTVIRHPNGSYSLQTSAESKMELSSIAIVGSQTGTRSSYRAGQTSIADKFNTPFIEQSQTSYAITQKTLDDFSVDNLEDTIKFVPGITIGNNFGGTQDSLVKRGFGGGTDGSTLRDGIRTSRGRHFEKVTTERVEILKGPASLFYGMQEPGGVINIITKKPTYHWRSTVGAETINEGGGRSYFDLSGPLGESGFAFRLIGQYKDQDYWRNYGVDRDKLVAPSLAYESEKFSFNLSYEYSDYSSVLDRGAFFYQGHHVGDRHHRLDEHWTRITGQRQYANLTTEYRFSDKSRLRFIYGWNKDASSDYQADPSTYNPATRELRRRFRSNPDFKKSRNYAALDWLTEVELAGMRHELILGVDSERHDESTAKFLQGHNVGGFNPDSPRYGNLRPVAPYNAANSDQRSRVRMLSVYGKDTIHLDEHWILSLGLRHQKFRQNDGQGIPYQVGTDLNKNRNLPFAGLVYKINDNFSLYGNYSESYKPNTIEAGNQVQNGSKPEEGRQYEFGFRYDNSRLSSLVTWYNIRKKNIQTNGLMNGSLATQTIGKARSRGLEANLNGHLNERWDVIFNYAYTDAEITKDPANEGNDLVNVARNVAGGFVSYDVPQTFLPGSLRVGGGARYVGRRKGDVANSFELSGYTTYDAFVSWSMPNTIGKMTRMQLNIENLTDKKYFISSGETANRVSWGAERIATFSASVDF
ncbi:TonB-dependent siderophore receptor [Azomonas macrocytogenes]|uniref:Iron complex outermembrane receptor protein n=1 Tax=Azomonas macrocytogenes TaxID=69962 RepID=A0A839T7E4_AZOMA|nr:TonB-dependent receptor [Azomonas macrocytogenes]MBB3104770.1 iron complex outermembrane receptor protein [Azomonas macrocytogenes]